MAGGAKGRRWSDPDISDGTKLLSPSGWRKDSTQIPCHCVAEAAANATIRTTWRKPGAHTIPNIANSLSLELWDPGPKSTANGASAAPTTCTTPATSTWAETWSLYSCRGGSSLMLFLPLPEVGPKREIRASKQTAPPWTKTKKQKTLSFHFMTFYHLPYKGVENS